MLRSPFGNKSEAQVLQALLAWSQGDAAMAAAAAIPQYSRELQGLLQSMLQVRAAVEHWVGLLSDSGWTTALCYCYFYTSTAWPCLLPFQRPASRLPAHCPAAGARGPPHRRPDPGPPRHARAAGTPAGAANRRRVRAALGGVGEYVPSSRVGVL